MTLLNRRAVKPLSIATALMMLFCGLAASAPALADEWPERPLTFVVTLGVGGSADRTARAISSFLPDYIGQPIKVINQKGAGGHVGNTYFLAQPDDGSVFLATSIAPYIANAILQQSAKYSLDDFAFVNAQWVDADLIALNKKRAWKTLPELLDAIKNKPRKISVSVVPGSTGMINTYILLDAAGIPRKNLNVVTYQSGSAARTAAAGGQVDFTILGADGSRGIAEFIRPLAVISEKPVKGWDAPPVNEALKPMGTTVPILTGSVRGLATHASFKKKYPERFANLADAYRRMVESKDFKKFAKRSGIGCEWVGPKATTAMVKANYEILKRYTKK